MKGLFLKRGYFEFSDFTGRGGNLHTDTWSISLGICQWKNVKSVFICWSCDQKSKGVFSLWNTMYSCESEMTDWSPLTTTPV